MNGLASFIVKSSSSLMDILHSSTQDFYRDFLIKEACPDILLLSGYGENSNLQRFQKSRTCFWSSENEKFSGSKKLYRNASNIKICYLWGKKEKTTKIRKSGLTSFIEKRAVCTILLNLITLKLGKHIVLEHFLDFSSSFNFMDYA